MKIKLLKRDIDRCEKFAKDRMSGSKNLYRFRGELSESKMLNDIKIGAMAELAVYRYFKIKGIQSTRPDLKIYDQKDKSFNADFASEIGNIHVKSQGIESAKRYGSSWLLQKKDPLLSQEHLNDYLVFCIVDGREVTIEHICHIKDIVENNCLDEPKVWRYKETKVAIYLDHVKKLHNMMEEL